jgi:hypothetical protein
MFQLDRTKENKKKGGGESIKIDSEGDDSGWEGEREMGDG